MNILGTEYRLLTECNLPDSDGMCAFYDKEILVTSPERMLVDSENMSDKKARYLEVLRHEIIHAYLYESGMEQYEDDEVLVAWLARMFPKLQKTFEAVYLREEEE